MAGVHNMMSGGGGRNVVNITVTGNVQNLNPYTYRNWGGTNITQSGTYVPNNTDVNLNINPGVYVGSASTGAVALDVDTSWAAGDRLTIVNNGFIVGCGGAGSGDGSYPGAPGGPGLRAQRPVFINNMGTIGGGGGGGGSSITMTMGGTSGVRGVGGGGGAGFNPGAGGVAADGLDGSSGAYTSGGAGCYVSDYPAGSGGSLGQSGGGGGDGTIQPGMSPGAGGNCTTAGSNANITWTNTGTRLGPIA